MGRTPFEGFEAPLNVGVPGGEKKIVPVGGFLEKYYKTLGNGTLELLGIKTGWDKLDQATLGLDGMIVLGGIAGQGKTSLALQLAFDVCEQGTPALFYSLEMPKRAIFTKILNRLAEVKYADILLNGRLYLDDAWLEKNPAAEKNDSHSLLTKEQIGRLHEAKDRLKQSGNRFYLRTRESKEAEIDFDSVEKEINEVRANHNAGKVLVAVDHLEVFKAGDYKDQIDKEGKLITGFKGITERTGATIILISQKNRAGFTSKGLQTIKASVDIVYLADVVMFLEDEDRQNINENDDYLISSPGGHGTRKISLVIEKNRYNAPCNIELDFNGEYSKFMLREHLQQAER